MAESALQALTADTTAAQQRTIARTATVSGPGLHSGEDVTVTFHPAEPDTGVTFIRTDLPGRPAVRAHVSNAVDSVRRTAIRAGAAEVHTIEHVMAALWGLHIDNVQIEISGVEVPGLDGSAKPFLEALKGAGLVPQTTPRQFFTLREPLWIETEHEGDAAIAALPHPEFRISYTLSYDHPLLKAQFAFFNGNGPVGFEQSIAPARTFCLEREAQELRKRGLGKGANYANTLVVGENGHVIENQLRFEDEFVRHKMLDLIGDLYLLGMPLKAHIIALKSGHALNLKLLRKLAWAMERAKSSAIRSGTGQVFQGPELDINMIKQILPHRYPFLLVDRIVEVEPDKRAVGIKNVTVNEPFFQGHFPERPVMPGVLLLEAMAQVGGILILNKPENAGKYVYFMSVDKAKFRKAVIPGDQLVLTVEVERFRGKTGFVRGTTSVDGKVVAEGELGFALVEGNT